MIKPVTASRFKTWRITKGLTVADAAKLLGVERTTIWRWENGNIQHPLLLALALFGLDRKNTL